MKAEHKAFYKDVVTELETGSLAIFAGAGLSVAAGHVNWKQLLKDITEDLGLNYDKETDLIAIAQYNANKTGNRSVINRKIIDEFNKDIESTENHEILSRLPVHSYWTTNYDNLIEKSLEARKRIPDVKHRVTQLPYPKPRRDAVVYKMHGDATAPEDAVITKDDYERYPIDNAGFLTALNSDMLSKLFVFIGFSFTDPNLDYILSRVRIQMRGAHRHHYHFVRRVSKADYPAGSEADYTFDRRKQELFVDDLRRFGLQPVYVDSYPEITSILKEIETEFKKKTVFISGSAEEYGTFTTQQAQGFIHKLSAELVGAGLRIVNGFGWGVGSAVINGALSKIYDKPEKYSREQLIVKPFPQFATGGKALDVLWADYRQDMISYAGIAVIIFGNKKNEAGEIELAKGVYKEFEIAKAKNLFVIPVYATGYMAGQIYEELEKIGFGIDLKAELLQSMKHLKSLTAEDEIIAQILKIINLINL